MFEKLEPKRIDLGAEFGGILVTRKLGNGVLERIAKELAAIPAGSCLVVDFSSVEIIDYSFADETIGKIISRIISGEFGERSIVIAELMDALRENLEIALISRELWVLELRRSGWDIIGPLKPHLRDVIELLRKQNEVSARDVAVFLGIAPNTAGNRLLELHKARLITRNEMLLSGGGKQYMYGLYHLPEVNNRRLLG